MRSFASAVLILALTALPAFAEANLGEATGAIRKAFGAQAALKARVTMKASLPVGTQRVNLTGEGMMIYQKQDNTEKYREDLVLQMPEPMRMRVEMQIVFDGDKVHIGQQVLGKTHITEGKHDLATGAIPPGGALLLDMMEEQLELRRLPDAKAEGEAVYSIEGKPKDGAAVPYVRALFLIDQATGILREMQLFETEGVSNVSLTQTEIELKPDLKDVTFDAPVAPPPPAETPPAADPNAPGQA